MERHCRGSHGGTRERQARRRRLTLTQTPNPNPNPNPSPNPPTLSPTPALSQSLTRLDAAAAPRLAEAIGLLQVCWLSRCQPLPTAPTAIALATTAPAAAGEESVAVAAAFGTVLGVYCGAIELWLGSHAAVRAAQP